MHFLADECCDRLVVKALRKAGHDVKAVSEISPGVEDSDVIRLAVREKRILLTEDKDFGQLVYAYGQTNGGVIFLRNVASARQQISDDLVRLVKQSGEKLVGRFVVVQPGRIRISGVPGE
jgi:predicted nuclease of predicted toxin-antitoxin system